MVRKSDKITKNIDHRGTKAILGPARATHTCRKNKYWWVKFNDFFIL